MDDLFSDLDALPSCCPVKRTYSRRHQPVSSARDYSGLATPPPSSSPPTSPYMPVRTLAVSSKSLNDSPVRSTKSLSGNSRHRTRMAPRSVNTLSTRKTSIKSKCTKLTKPMEDAKPKLVQMQFNLLPSHITCKECGMSYTRTSPPDISLHRAYHETHLYGLEVPASYVSQGDRVGYIKLAYVKQSEINFIRKCCKVVDAELSASTPPLDASFQLFGLVKSAHGGSHPRLLSFVLCRPTAEAYPLLDSGELDTNNVRPVIMGVSRLWTAKSARGCGIARALLDKMCKTCVVGCDVKKSEVAFTQLSGSGQSVVRKWLGNEASTDDHDDARVLVYNE